MSISLTTPDQLQVLINSEILCQTFSARVRWFNVNYRYYQNYNKPTAKCQSFIKVYVNQRFNLTCLYVFEIPYVQVGSVGCRTLESISLFGVLPRMWVVRNKVVKQRSFCQSFCTSTSPLRIRRRGFPSESGVSPLTVTGKVLYKGWTGVPFLTRELTFL